MRYKAVDHVNCARRHFAFLGTLCDGFGQVLIAFVPLPSKCSFGIDLYQRQLVVIAIGFYENVIIEVEWCIMVQTISLNKQTVK